MTETLGWGDVDVDAEPRRRRRLPPVVVWVAVAAVVAGVAYWPTMKDGLADRAAAWLQRQWMTSQAYESSRSAIEVDATERIAVGDFPGLARMAQALDREESDRLTAIATAIGRHRMWAANVQSVSRSIQQALRAEARDLRADVTVAAEELSTFGYVEEPLSGSTQSLVLHASDKLQRLLLSRHLTAHPKVTARLTSADSEVAALRRLTAVPLDLRLAVVQNSQLDVWDLRTNRVRKNVIGLQTANSPIGVLPVVGSSLLESDENWELWPTAGPRPVRLPATSSNDYYRPAGDSGLWRNDGTRIRRYDATGNPVGPWHDYPQQLLQQGAVAATADAILSSPGSDNFNASHPVLWYPDTGRVLSLPDECLWSVASARSTIASVSCDQTQLRLLDTRSGRVTNLPIPRGVNLMGVGPTMSADGTKVALQVQPEQKPDHPMSSVVVIFDVATRHVTTLDTIAIPLAWSADGSVLLFDINGEAGSPTTSVLAPLGYWKPGMTDLAGIRINLASGEYAVAILP